MCSQKFIGREKEIEQFLQYLTQSPEAPQNPLLIINIHGQSGMGKTYLLQQFRHLALESGNLSVYLDGDETDIPTIMGTVVKKLGEIDCNLRDIEKYILTNFPTFSRFISPLKKLSSANPQLFVDQNFKKFNDQYKLYLQCRSKIDNDPEKPQGLSNFVGKTTAKVGLSFGKKVPGIDTVLEFFDDEELSKQAEEWAAFIAKKFNSKDEKSLMRDPLSILTPLFWEGLKNLTQEKLVVICFDNYERVTENVGIWLRNCLDEDYGKIPQTLIFAIACRKEINLFQWANYEDKIERICLQPFTELEAKQYIENKGITENNKVNNILHISGKIPGVGEARV
ncbi:ATP-binding protein [Okeania sp. KiyG1]|uniref:ATP-binding protein n=1 Tax=Okeania sp. KiyG1 TaxID=2720165 RepID=UPI001923ED90|nr:ATP-binding protein [Okeania sp. KiyG1]GGA57356.1 hypothetical protein CYANOKiyG1_78400 [Okeania sp. KiyG1]